MKADPTLKRIEPYILAIKARLDENRIVESLIAELARANLANEQLERRVKSLIAKLELRDTLLPDIPKLYSGRTESLIEASTPLSPLQGFYALEYNELGQPFRWTGPSENFFVDLALDRTDELRFSLLLAGWSPPEAIADITARVDGQEVLIAREPVGGNVRISGLLPQWKTPGISRISFDVAELFTPEGEKGADARKLGVAFLSLQIEPALQETLELAARQA